MRVSKTQKTDKRKNKRGLKKKIKKAKKKIPKKIQIKENSKITEQIENLKKEISAQKIKKEKEKFLIKNFPEIEKNINQIKNNMINTSKGYRKKTNEYIKLIIFYIQILGSDFLKENILEFFKENENFKEKDLDQIFDLLNSYEIPIAEIYKKNKKREKIIDKKILKKKKYVKKVFKKNWIKKVKSFSGDEFEDGYGFDDN